MTLSRLDLPEGWSCVGSPDRVVRYFFRDRIVAAWGGSTLLFWSPGRGPLRGDNRVGIRFEEKVESESDAIEHIARYSRMFQCYGFDETRVEPKPNAAEAMRSSMAFEQAKRLGIDFKVWESMRDLAQESPLAEAVVKHVIFSCLERNHSVADVLPGLLLEAISAHHDLMKATLEMSMAAHVPSGPIRIEANDPPVAQKPSPGERG